MFHSGWNEGSKCVCFFMILLTDSISIERFKNLFQFASKV